MVFQERPKELVCYTRFLDDLFMIREGYESSHLSFMDTLNQNNKNIVLTWKYDHENMVFPDVEIMNNKGVYILTITVNLQIGMIT